MLVDHAILHMRSPISAATLPCFDRDLFDRDLVKCRLINYGKFYQWWEKSSNLEVGKLFCKIAIMNRTRQ